VIVTISSCIDDWRGRKGSELERDVYHKKGNVTGIDAWNLLLWSDNCSKLRLLFYAIFFPFVVL
jgi:hypothetical protein